MKLLPNKEELRKPRFKLYILGVLLAVFVVLISLIPKSYLFPIRLPNSNYVRLGSEFIIKPGKTVKFINADMEFTLDKIYDIGCFADGTCPGYTGPAISWTLHIDGQEHTNFSEIPYSFVKQEISSDLTYAQFIIDTKESRCRSLNVSNDCWSNLAISRNDLSICELPEDSVVKSDCIEKYADFNQVTSLCSEVTVPRGYCLARDVAQTESISACVSIGHWKFEHQCYKDIAKITGKGISVCELLDENNKGQCTRSIEGMIKDYERMGKDWRFDF